MTEPEGAIHNTIVQVPLVTRSIILICVLLQLISWGYPSLLNSVVICPGPVVSQFQVYRIISSVFFHSGALHIVMNMMTLFYLGKQLEQKFGSSCFLGLVLLFATLGGLLYVCVGWVVYLLSSKYSWFYYCSVGFSGVLFSLQVVDTKTNLDPTRTLFGVITLPSWIFPWVALFLIQMLMPGISFLGHLSGILVGLCYINGWLNWLTISRQRVLAWESSPCLQSIVTLSSFKACPPQDFVDFNRGGYFAEFLNRFSRTGSSVGHQFSTVDGEGSQGYRLGGRSVVELNRGSSISGGSISESSDPLV